MSPSLLSDAARVMPRAPHRGPRGPAHRRDAPDPRPRRHRAACIAAALLIDAVRSGHLDVLEGRRVVAGRASADEPLLLGRPPRPRPHRPPGSPLRWIERTAEFAPHRIATELVTAGIAMPLSPRFHRTFTLSVNARAEAAARARIATDPALAVLLYACGLPTGDPLPPSRPHPAAPRERAILRRAPRNRAASALRP